MKNAKKKAIALVTLVSLVLSAFAGCSKKSESSVSLTEADLKTPFTFKSGLGDDSADDDPYNLNGKDPEQAATSASGEETTDAGAEPSTEVQDVTAADGEPVTEIVTATDASGAVVTDAAGQPSTIVQKVTEVVTKPADASSGDPTATTPADTYVSSMEQAYALWIDISKDENFMFNDSFINLTLKVKEDIPDGVYDIAVVDPDFASIEGKTVDPSVVYDGKIFVNTKADAQPDVSGETGLTVYGDYIECKQGDEITFCYRIKNNPGMAGMCFKFKYDSNAFDVIECVPDGEFAEAAKNADIGGV